MSAVYAFFVAVYVYGEIGLKDVPRVLLRSANLTKSGIDYQDAYTLAIVRDIKVLP